MRSSIMQRSKQQQQPRGSAPPRSDAAVVPPFLRVPALFFPTFTCPVFFFFARSSDSSIAAHRGRSNNPVPTSKFHWVFTVESF